jgi:3-hydroxybutyryl-CoA dehydrogenase
MNQQAGPLPREVSVAVIGAGTMGGGIALVAATAGHSVLLYDAAPGAAEAGCKRQRTDLERLVTRGKLTAEDCKDRLSRLHPVESLGALARAGLVIEAIVENLDIKADVLRQVEELTNPRTIVATNTSSLSITALSSRMRRPSQVVGMHFFNPAPVLPLVEVVSGRLTEASVAQTIFATALAWGKIPVHCASSPGFIVNRVARPFYGEALRLLSERAASPATLDAILRETGGFRMGPFALMDLIGHDVNFAVTRSVYDGMSQDARYKPSLVQEELVNAGLLGRKSGRGFYDYRKDAQPALPADCPAGPKPGQIIVEGDLGPAGVLVGLARAAGIAVCAREGAGLIRLDRTTLALTDGRTATERMASDRSPNVLFDLALDYATASRMAITRADQADDEAIAEAAGFFQALGKTVSVVDDAPGLVVMRTVAMLANEAANVVHQGVANAVDVDVSMLKGVNYPRGPLAWADDVGPARISGVIDALARAYGEDRYRNSPLLYRRALTGFPFHKSS